MWRLQQLLFNEINKNLSTRRLTGSDTCCEQILAGNGGCIMRKYACPGKSTMTSESTMDHQIRVCFFFIIHVCRFETLQNTQKYMAIPRLQASGIRFYIVHATQGIERMRSL